MLGEKAIREAIKKRELVIEPFFEENVKENGIDLTLDGEIALLQRDCLFDFEQSSDINVAKCFKKIKFDDEIILPPNRNILLLTQERIELNGPLVGLVAIKSTIARAGILSPPTVVDYGFKGKIVIEALTPSFQIKIFKGMPFVHLILYRLEGCGMSYAEQGHYQGQSEIVFPRTPLKKFVF